ncbi:MAG: two-component regulator propeller domain-containing protein [Leptospirillia bacterium]
MTIGIVGLSACTRSVDDTTPSTAGNHGTDAARHSQNAEKLAKPMWTQFEINSSVHALAFRGTDVWVGTEAGLLRYDQVRDEVTAKYDTGSGLLSNNVMSLDMDSDGSLWVGTHGGGLTHISDTGVWSRYSVPDLGDSFVYQALPDVMGRGLWVATWSGLSHLENGAWRTYTTADGLVDDWVYAMVQDDDGTLWLGTEGGVSVFDGKTSWSTYTHADGLGAGKDRVEDYEAIGNPSRHHRTAPGKEATGYNPNYVLAALIDGDGNKWFGTWGAGLSRFDGNSWVTYTHTEGLGGNFVTDLHADADGTIWATTDGGVSVFRGGKWQNFDGDDGLISDAVFDVTTDARGRKWFGTMAGVSRLDGFMDREHVGGQI